MNGGEIIRWVSATRIEVLTPVVAASVWHVHAEGWYWCLGDTAATAVKSGGPMKRDAAVVAAIDAVETQARPVPLYSTRAAMRDAGLPDWEPGSGMSSADAIRELARQRDEVQENARIERENCRTLEAKLAEVCKILGAQDDDPAEAARVRMHELANAESTVFAVAPSAAEYRKSVERATRAVRVSACKFCNPGPHGPALCHSDGCPNM